MCAHKIVAVSLVFLVSSISYAAARQVKQVTCTDKVVDAQGRPIAGAKVSLNHIVYDESTRAADSKLAIETRTTANDGGFSFTATPEGDSQEHDFEVLIDKYNSCNKKFQTIYYDLETTLQVGSEQYVYSFQYCSDNEKMKWIGGLKCYKEDGSVNQNASTKIIIIIDYKRGIALNSYNPELKGKLPPTAFILPRDKISQQFNELASHGAPIKGKLDGSNGQSIYDLLKGASNVKLSNKVTKIIGYGAYLIEANTKYGTVKAWISPDLDYNCVKWEIIKNQNQFYRNGKLTNDEFTKWTAAYDAEKVEQIDGQYFITQAKFNHRVDNGDIILSNHTYHYNLNPTTPLKVEKCNNV